MAEQRLFETRLAEALRAYAEAAPVAVDPLAIATITATAAGPRSRWAELTAALRIGSGRFALLIATLLLLLALAVAALVGSGLFHPSPLPPNVLGFVETGPMSVSRHGLSAVRLADGRVLAMGGHTPDLGAGWEVSYTAAEVWDPRTGLFSPTGSMAAPRLLFQATLLSDGKVLVEGGDPATDAIAGAELFDPATGTWTRTGAMAGPRRMQAATLLADGQVLIAGGHDGQAALATAELYNPADGRFGPTGSLPEPISLPSAVLLEDGRVLLAGGLGADGNPTAAAFLYDPAADGWTKTGSMPVSRVRPVLTRLDDGRVLVFDTGATAVDLYDPRTGTFGPTGAMAVGHTTATLLGDGRVLVAGGDTDEAELYDPKTGTFGPTEPLNSAAPIDAAVALLDGRVLLVRGGEARSELFDPGSTHTASSSSPAASPTAAPTPPDACSLLTSADVSAIRGVPVGPGDPSNGSAGTPDCQWLPEDGDGDPVLQIAIWFDDPRLWSSLATHPYFTPATIDGHPALVNGDPAQGQTIWVEVPRYVISIGALSPQPDGAKTPDREQQLAILARILAHLH